MQRVNDAVAAICRSMNQGKYPTPTTILPLYQVYDSPAKGGLGVFATADIPSGTLIFSEKHLLAFDAASNHPTRSICSSIAAQVKALPEADREVFDKLWFPHDTVRSGDVMMEIMSKDKSDDEVVSPPAKKARTIKSFTSTSALTSSQEDNEKLPAGMINVSIAHAASIKQEPASPPPEELGGTQMPLSQLCRQRDVSGVQKRKQLLAQLPDQHKPQWMVRNQKPRESNHEVQQKSPHLSLQDVNIYITATSNGVSYRGPDGRTHTGIFPTAARINHSCDPNVVFSIDHNGIYHLRARRTVVKGEELVVSYVPEFLSEASRRSEVWRNHGFVCNCVRCRNTTDGVVNNGAAVDRNRKADSFGTNGNQLGSISGATGGFMSAVSVRVFELEQHQVATEAGVDLDELHQWILELKARAGHIITDSVKEGQEEMEPVELFTVYYALAEAYCGLGLILRSHNDINTAMSYHEQASNVGARHWGGGDVFVREQQGCIMELKVQLAKIGKSRKRVRRN